jgi:NAD(P)-dependent dehydrogenase (short-subunit alcohol dehydrogenase family)
MTQSIFITGGASGMGRATAKLFHERGWLVGAVDVNEGGLKSLAGELGAERCWTRRLDVTDRADYDRAIAGFAERTEGGLDLLFNNAGIGHGGWFEDVPYEATRREIEVNFIGVVNGIYAALPLLKTTPNSLCFTTSSSAATYGMPFLAIYSATKFAVKGLTEALSLEFERHGVRASDVLPGAIDTPILDSAGMHSPEFQRDEDVRKSLPKEGPMRLMPPESIAECVWQAYHDTTGRLHWYVPEDIQVMDEPRASAVEGMRDRMRMMVQARTMAARERG